MDLYDVFLSEIYFLTLREKVLLRKNIDCLDNLVVLSISDICKIIGRTVKSQNWNPLVFHEKAKKSFFIMQNKKIGGICYRDDDYPILLKEMLNPPYIIFYRGNPEILKNHCIGVVGTRQICSESAKAAMNFAKDACDAGNTIISGLAFGIDSYAHKGCLQSSKAGNTCAVLPCGIDEVVPSANKTLAMAILKNNGCLISEYMPGTPAEPWKYVQRNRIIAGLCQSVIVVQAPPKSGALITANFAIENNRDLYFHEAAFCKDAEMISQKVYEKISVKSGIKDKEIDTPKEYVENGALIIKNYADYSDKVNLNLLNGKNKGQLDLF